MAASPVDGVGFRFIETNGIRMRLAESGTGPLVVLAHGWPDSWYSWRHQLTALADAGYRVVAPDMRGYGETDAPGPVEAYDIVELSSDMVGVLDALAADRAHLVGHDWGSMVAAHTALSHPDRFASLTLMSVPYGHRAPAPPTEILSRRLGDDFFYILYHNEPGGVAEAEYDADPRGLLSRLYQSPGAPRREPEITDPKRSAGGMIPRIGQPEGHPDWLDEDGLDLVVALFERSGFRGGVNYYRNLDRNWELTADRADRTIPVPTLFVGGAADGVIAGASADDIAARMATTVADLRDVVLIPEVGHWVQQEAPQAVTTALLDVFAAVGS